MKKEYIKCIEINNDDELIQDTSFLTRKKFVSIENATIDVDISIIVVIYKNIEKTKNCIRAILENTRSYNYELILLDNGSNDGTLEYLKSIKFEKKRIIYTTQNIGLCWLIAQVDFHTLAKFVVRISNDVIVTPGWLDNMMECIQSDEKIGMVAPVSSNTMGFQGLNLCMASAPYHDVQKKGQAYNQQKISIWEERLALVDICVMFRKEALLATGFPIQDVAYIHGNEFDQCFRMRRSGYKLILTRGTWVHHDHDYSQKRQEGAVGFKNKNEHILDSNTEDHFTLRWGGIKLFDDIYNFLLHRLDNLPIQKKNFIPQILGVDVRCGQPILDIKNRLQRENISQVISYAFSQADQYMPDLRSICGIHNAYCDREEFFRDYFSAEFFDYIVVDRPINQYKEPIKFYRDVLGSLKKGGILFISLLNTQSYVEFLSMAVDKNAASNVTAVHIPVERFINLLNKDVDIIQTFYEAATLEPKELLSQSINGLCQPNQREDLVNRMLVNKYIFMVRKKNSV